MVTILPSSLSFSPSLLILFRTLPFMTPVSPYFRLGSRGRVQICLAPQLLPLPSQIQLELLVVSVLSLSLVSVRVVKIPLAGSIQSSTSTSIPPPLEALISHSSRLHPVPGSSTAHALMRCGTQEDTKLSNTAQSVLPSCHMTRSIWHMIVFSDMTL